MLHLNINKSEARIIELAANLLDDCRNSIWLELRDITYKWHFLTLILQSVKYLKFIVNKKHGLN